MKNGTKLSIIFVIVGFIGLGMSAYGYEIDNDNVIAFSILIAVVSLALALFFVSSVSVKEMKDETKKQD